MQYHANMNSSAWPKYPFCWGIRPLRVLCGNDRQSWRLHAQIVYPCDARCQQKTFHYLCRCSPRQTSSLLHKTTQSRTHFWNQRWFFNAVHWLSRLSGFLSHRAANLYQASIGWLVSQTIGLKIVFEWKSRVKKPAHLIHKLCQRVSRCVFLERAGIRLQLGVKCPSASKCEALKITSLTQADGVSDSRYSSGVGMI